MEIKLNYFLPPIFDYLFFQESPLPNILPASMFEEFRPVVCLENSWLIIQFRLEKFLNL